MEQSIAELVSASDLVIVGIGSEWNWVNNGLKKDGRYSQILEYCSKEENRYLLPIVEYEYQHFNSDKKTEDAYKGLKALLKEKKYFIVTDLFLQDAVSCGFDLKKFVNPCGNYDYLQSSSDDELLKAEDVPEFMDIVNSIHKIVTEFGGNIEINDSLHKIFLNGKQLYLNQKRSEYSKIKYNESAYIERWDSYMKYLSSTLNKNLLILELGVGLEYPTVVRWPFEKVTFINKKAHLVRVHEKLFQYTKEIADKTDSIQMNSVDFILQESKGL